MQMNAGKQVSLPTFCDVNMTKSLIVFLGTILVGRSHFTAAADLESRDCNDIKLKNAVCMRAIVPENYEAPSGRKISLDIVILKAAHPGKDAKSLFILEGGPGQRATESAEDEYEVWQKVAQTRDLVLIDQRGTGTTPDLHCANASEEKKVLLKDLWPVSNLERCAKMLSQSVDLSRYNTTDSARDLDEVRAALHYSKIDIVAYSYGTRLAQEYLRRYEKMVRSVMLIGPVPPGSFTPADYARQNESTLMAVLDRCVADQECSTAFPDIYGDLARLKAKLTQVGLTVPAIGSAPDASTNPNQISAGIIVSYLRYKLYSVTTAATVPFLIHTLASDNPNQAEILAIANWRDQFAQAAPWGLYTSIICSEDLPFIDLKQQRRLAAGTLLGTYRIDQQSAVCEKWPRSKIASDFHSPITSNVPVLILSGQYDPATPYIYGEQIAVNMSNSRLMRLPNRSHAGIEEGDTCLEKLTQAFVDEANPNILETSCVDRLRFPKFKIS